MCKIEYKFYSIEAVANQILTEAWQQGLSVTNMKIQKLAYFVQGFALKQLEHPLFTEEIQAWTYGPVIPELYKKLKHFGANPITGFLASSDAITDDEDAKNVIKNVVDKLGKLSAPQLVELSHQPNSPWAAAWEEKKYSRIPLWQMTIYFDRMLTPSAS
ncbi:type II toxin-antitoxin system antitoxin SocA domain-containing protein [uncultured Akkermansia sp.]|uniref:Panacea domain-containing protein n=1 Tax=uncultured Akkermansia sp. TaxID=512294 RepID=UPI0025E76F0B|nr:type II toxin-antitoxin system antitoxin SocA domain-containing protein [uncultured Akkermansia sp.]